MTLRPLDVAQHEAAHAVVGVYLGLPLRAARLRRANGLQGYTHFRCTLARRVHLGVMYAAGPAGDAIHGRNEPQKWELDFQELDAIWFTESEIRILIDTATHYLKGPCARAWRETTEVLLHRDVTGPEIKALILHGETLE